MRITISESVHLVTNTSNIQRSRLRGFWNRTALYIGMPDVTSFPRMLFTFFISISFFCLFVEKQTNKKNIFIKHKVEINNQ